MIPSNAPPLPGRPLFLKQARRQAAAPLILGALGVFGQGVGLCLKTFHDTGGFGQRLCAAAVRLRWTPAESISHCFLCTGIYDVTANISFVLRWRISQGSRPYGVKQTANMDRLWLFMGLGGWEGGGHYGGSKIKDIKASVCFFPTSDNREWKCLLFYNIHADINAKYDLPSHHCSILECINIKTSFSGSKKIHWRNKRWDATKALGPTSVDSGKSNVSESNLLERRRIKTSMLFIIGGKNVAVLWFWPQNAFKIVPVHHFSPII